MDNADRHTLDELDAFLDRTFQGRAADSSALDPGLTECARRLYARDDAPAADPIFLRNLREDLMITPRPALTGSAHAYPPSIVVPPRIAKPRLLPPAPKSTLRTLNHWRRRAWPAIELLGAAMLLLGLLAGAFVTYNNGPAALNQTAGSDVAMLGGNPARTGEMPGPGPEGQPGLVWKSQVGINHDLAPYSAPVVANDKVYLVASGLTGFADQFFLVAMDAATGQNLWQVRLDGTAYATPAVANGMVYVGITTHNVVRGEPVGTPDPIGTDLGYVVAFNAATGAEEWRQETRGSQASSPAFGNGSLFIGSTDGGMYAFEAETGDPLWQSDAAILDEAFWERNRRELKPLASSTPAVGDGLVVIASSLGAIHALDVQTGEEMWSTRMPAGQVGMPVISGDLVLINIERVDPYLVSESIASPGPSNDGASPNAVALMALSVATGGVEWILSSPAENIAPVAADSDRLYVIESTRDRSEIRGIDPDSADNEWTVPLNGRVLGAPTVAGRVVYVGSGDGQIHALDAATGDERWTARIGGFSVAPIWIEDGMLYIHSGTERSIYALGSTSAGAGTPAASPAVDGDVSGLPPCTVEPRASLDTIRLADAALATPAVTPEASVVAVTDLQRQGQPAARLPEDVPDGPPATDNQIAEIKATLKELAACNRPGNDLQVAAFYSDDFFRRPWVAAFVDANGLRFFWVPEDSARLQFEGTHVLDDGRVGVLIRLTDVDSRFLIFVKSEGRWLIDETVQVGPLPEGFG